MSWLLLAMACTGPGDPDPVEVEPPMAVVATVADDYTTGALTLVSLDDLEVDDQVLPTTPDPQVVVEEGVVYLLERDAASSLSAWDPLDWSEPAWEVGVGDNPHDVSRCGEHLLVSLYDEDHLEVRDPATGRRTGEVDLGEYDDGDGLPEASGLVRAAGRVFVALHQFDRDVVGPWQPDGGLVAEVDCEALVVSDTWSPGPAPDIFPHPSDPEALVVRTGAWWSPDGALAELHPDEGLGAPWLSEADLGGEALLYFAGTPEGSLVVSAGDEDFWTSTVRCLDPSGAVSGEVSVDAALWGAAADDRGRVWTPARTTQADPGSPGGLVLWDPATCTEDRWVHTDLQPYHLAFVP